MTDENKTFIQAIVFIMGSKNKWSEKKAREYIHEKGLVPINQVNKYRVDGEIKQLKYQINDKRYFKKFNTITIQKDLLYIVGSIEDLVKVEDSLEKLSSSCHATPTNSPTSESIDCPSTLFNST